MTTTFGSSCFWGAGEHFSAGHDLGTPEELADQEERPWRGGIRGWYERTHEQFYDNTMRWRNLPKPTVAAVQGYCIFGGWMIASAMDVIFAADDAMFLGSHFQWFCVPWDLPVRKAKELLYEPRFMDAHEAERCGLVNRVLPRDQLVDETLAWAGRVAENDPFQLRMTKLAANQVQDNQGYPAPHDPPPTPCTCSAASASAIPDSIVVEPGGRRRPMVQKAMENFEASRPDRPESSP